MEGKDEGVDIPEGHGPEWIGINFIRDSGFALRDWVLGNSIAGDLSGMKTGSGGEPG